MTLAARIAAFQATYAKWPASWPHLVKEGGRDVLYATWLIGNHYRNATRYYGAYPPGYLKRIAALFPDVEPDATLHVFAGSLPEGVWRMDVSLEHDPTIPGSVYDARTLIDRYVRKHHRFRLLVADPPYSSADAVHYKTTMISRGRALAALATVTKAGGHLVWLDVCWPMHRKAEWVTVGRIAIVRSTNHRVRMATIFERAA